MGNSWIRAAGVLSMLAAAGFGTYFAWHALAPRAARQVAPPETVPEFIARHWPEALAPQGDPPAGLSPVEASLGPDACGQCHARQFGDWKTSLHARSMGPGIQWQLHAMSQQGANRCLRCHAPLAEQKALLALERGWANAPSTPAPPHVPADLHRRGLVCAACHVRRHERFGPPPRPDAVVAAADAPHGGFSVQAAFQDSLFCAVCHQFPADGARLNGKLIEDTYEEWRASPAARAGQSCQSCHMPDRRHLWRGIHDADMVRQALRVRLSLHPEARGEYRAEAELANTGAGHHFPTYLIPEVVATLALMDPGGRVRAILARHVIGRKADLGLTREISDTRIASGERVLVGGRFASPPTQGWSVELRVVVHPDKHYELLFRNVLERGERRAPEAERMLREALAQAESSTFELFRLREAVPAR
ncbi:MAG: multiheme c-type cytochrome [Burkholderiales bacterium]